MDGKIALEEHWGLPETLAANFATSGGTSDWLNEVHRLLPDIHGQRLAEMDENGIELTIISLLAPAVQGIPDVAEAIALARKANDTLAEEIAKRPDRFAGFAALPMQDPDEAIAELRRCVNDLGFHGPLVNGFTQKDVEDSAIYYDVPEYRPFWAAVDELGVPFYLHPRLQIPTRIAGYGEPPWLYAPGWDFGSETAVHALRLIISGLFDDFPNLRIVMGHLGERIPFDLWRIDNFYEKTPHKFPARRPIGDYFRENFHLTTSGQFHDAAFHCSLAQMGTDRLMYSVDYPYESNADAAAWFDETELSDEDRLKIGRTNAVKLFKLDM